MAPSNESGAPAAAESGALERSVRWECPPRRSKAYVAVSLCLGAVLFFVLPYFLPCSPTLSDSYGYGFNNRAAVVLLILFVLGFAYWYGPLREKGEADPATQDGSRTLGAVLLLAVVLHLAVWLLQRHFGPIQEGLYFYDRVEHLATGGHVFRDFEFAYGALLLYLPLWLAKLPGLSLLTGYSLSMLLEQVCGLLLFWYVLRQAAGSNPHWRAVFLFVSGTMLAWTPLAGAQYTALRYWIGPAALVLSYRLAFHYDRRLIAGATVFLGACAALAVAPEQVAGVLGGAWLFTLFFLRRAWRWVLPGLLLLTVVIGGVLFLCNRAHVLDTLRTIGSGAYALPIAPSFPVLLVLSLLLAAACTGVEMYRRRCAPNVQLLLLCMAPFTLVAAFGRCEPGHAISNTLAAGVVGWLAIARSESLWRRFAWTYGVVVFIAPTQLPLVYLRDLKLLLENRVTPIVDVRLDHRPVIRAFGSPFPTTPGAFALPYRLDTGRFYGTTDLISPEQVQEALGDLTQQTGSLIVAGPIACGGVTGRGGLYISTGGFFFPKARRKIDIGGLCPGFQQRTEPESQPGFPVLPGVQAYRVKQP